jgi:hypothetical protein
MLSPMIFYIFVIIGLSSNNQYTPPKLNKLFMYNKIFN